MATQNGASTYLILDSLDDQQKYGLEIIEHITNRTGGGYIMKKPTLYSSLTRMEKKGLVSSSYWGDSEIGGKRHYYALTDAGKALLQELSAEYANADFTSGEYSVEETSSPENVQTGSVGNAETAGLNQSESASQNMQSTTEKTMVLQQENLFDLANKNSQQTFQTQTSAQNQQNGAQSSQQSAIDNQIDFFSYNTNTSTDTNTDAAAHETREYFQLQPAQDDGKLLSESERIFEQNTAAPSAEQNNEQNVEQNDEQKMEQYRTMLENHTPAPSEKLSEYQEAQNRRLFDTSTELKKYRKRKSFSENQIEMAVVYEDDEDEKLQQQRIQQLKNSLLSAREGHFDQMSQTNSAEQFSQPTTQQALPTAQPYQTAQQGAEQFQEPYAQAYANMQQAQPAQQQFAQPQQPQQTAQTSFQQAEIDNGEREDDAVFITTRIAQHEIPIQRKIAPTSLEIEVTDDNLPAPKRNANLEPTYKDMMAKLFERRKEKSSGSDKNASSPATAQNSSQNSAQNSSQNIQAAASKGTNGTKNQTADSYAQNTNAYTTDLEELDSFADYESLKKYYRSHDIEFKEHIKTKVERNHNTNFLTFISSIVMFVLSAISSALVFWIVSATGNLSASSNFLYYTIPVLFAIYSIFALLRHQFFVSKKAALTHGSVVIWATFVLGALVVLVANVIAGMQYQQMGTYLTSMLLPILALLIALPVNYYTKKFLFKKFAR